MRVPVVLVLVLVLSACGASEPAQPPTPGPTTLAWPADRDAAQLDRGDLTSVSACTDGTPVLTSDSLGGLYPGQTLLEVLVLCPSAQLLWDWGDEGVPSPALLMRVGRAVVSATVEDTLPSSRMVALTVRDEHVRTREGFGVGSAFQELRSALGSPRLYEGECVIEAVFEQEPGVVWRLDMPEDTLDCQDIPPLVQRNAVDQVPSGSRIQSVRVVGPNGAEQGVAGDVRPGIVSEATIVRPHAPELDR